jgi:hypothetical protein
VQVDAQSFSRHLGPDGARPYLEALGEGIEEMSPLIQAMTPKADVWVRLVDKPSASVDGHKSFYTVECRVGDKPPLAELPLCLSAYRILSMGLAALMPAALPVARAAAKAVQVPIKKPVPPPKNDLPWAIPEQPYNSDMKQAVGQVPGVLDEVERGLSSLSRKADVLSGDPVKAKQKAKAKQLTQGAQVNYNRMNKMVRLMASLSQRYPDVMGTDARLCFLQKRVTEVHQACEALLRRLEAI